MQIDSLSRRLIDLRLLLYRCKMNCGHSSMGSLWRTACSYSSSIGRLLTGCVRASTLDALCHGFVPFVIEDACADRAPGPHEANLFDMKAKYAGILSTDEAMEKLGA